MRTRARKGREWRVEKVRNKELHSLYRSPNILTVIKSRRLVLAEYAARMEEGKILTGKSTANRLLERIRCRL